MYLMSFMPAVTDNRSVLWTWDRTALAIRLKLNFEIQGSHSGVDGSSLPGCVRFVFE
jgi:hypothetical protein